MALNTSVPITSGGKIPRLPWPRSLQIQHVFDFRGGQNDTAAPDNLGANEMLTAQNIDPFLRGGFRRRPGIVADTTHGTRPISRFLDFEYPVEGVPTTKRLMLVQDDAAAVAKLHPTSLTVNAGILADGTFASLAAGGGTDVVQIDEDNGTPGFDFEVGFSNISKFNRITFRCYYIGGQNHQVDVGLWNYLTGEWDFDLITFYNQTGYEDLTITTPFTNRYVQNGNLKMRFNHPQSEHTSHIFYLDFVELSFVSSDAYSLYVEGNGTPIQTGMDKHMDWEIFQHKLYILSNGKYLKYDGTTLAAATATDDVKKCRYLIQRGQRLFAAGNPDSPNTLYYSDRAAPETWNALSIVEAISDDADVITGLAEFHGALLVFKARSVYAWFGNTPSADVEFVKLNVHTGTRAYRSICNVDNLLIYLGDDGVYAMAGVVKDVINTRKISRTMNNTLKNTWAYGRPEHESPCATFYDGRYYLSFPSDPKEDNDTVIVLRRDMMNPSDDVFPWVVYRGWNISHFFPSLDGKLYSSNGTTGIIHYHDPEVFSDLGEPIEVIASLAPISAGYPMNLKKFRRGYIATRQALDELREFTLHLQIDYREREHELVTADSLVWEEREWDLYKWDYVDLVTRRFDMKLKGKRLYMTLTSNILDEELIVYGFMFEYKIKKPDKS